MTKNLPKIVFILSKIIADLDIIEVIDPSSLDFRIVVQKLGYIYQKIGQDIGLKYGWFSLGPYSKFLQNYYTSIAMVLNEIKNKDIDFDVELNTETMLAIEKVEKFLNEYKNCVEIVNFKTLEVLASLIMLCSDIYPKPEDPVEEFLKRKKNFSKNLVEKTWRFLTEKNMCS